MKHRMTLEISESSKIQLDSLQEQTGAASNAEVIRRAISIYAALVTHGTGRVELIDNKGNRKELLVVL